VSLTLPSRNRSTFSCDIAYSDSRRLRGRRAIRLRGVYRCLTPPGSLRFLGTLLGLSEGVEVSPPLTVEGDAELSHGG
jgi:hypothetical protein